MKHVLEKSFIEDIARKYMSDSEMRNMVIEKIESLHSNIQENFIRESYFAYYTDRDALYIVCYLDKNKTMTQLIVEHCTFRDKELKAFLLEVKLQGGK